MKALYVTDLQVYFRCGGGEKMRAEWRDGNKNVSLCSALLSVISAAAAGQFTGCALCAKQPYEVSHELNIISATYGVMLL